MAKAKASAVTEIDPHELQEARAAARKKADELFRKEMEGVTKPCREAIAALEKERQQLQDKLSGVEDELSKTRKTLNKVLGIEEKPSSPGRTGGKMTKVEMNAAVEKVVPALSKSDWVPTASIAGSVGLDKSVVASVIAKLKRDKFIKSNGIKGTNGAVKLA